MLSYFKLKIFLYMIYKFIKYLYLNIKYTNILKKIYINENILDNLSLIFETKFKIDWIGRIYTVINPNINNKNFDINTQIFEYDENGLNNTMYIERFIMTKLNIANNFIQTNNLFDLLTYEIKKLDEYDNYLLIIEPITLKDCLKYTKRFCILISILLIIMTILLIIF